MKYMFAILIAVIVSFAYIHTNIHNCTFSNEKFIVYRYASIKQNPQKKTKQIKKDEITTKFH